MSQLGNLIKKLTQKNVDEKRKFNRIFVLLKTSHGSKKKQKMVRYALSKGYEQDLVFDVLNGSEED